MNACTLCPRACHALRTPEVGHGFCRMPETMRIARIAPHLWEEPPISGQRGTGAVFFSGCTLRCVYCQNADISHRDAGRSFTPQALAESLRRLVEMGMETISLITATPFIPKILETLEIYRPPVPLVWNTSGYESVDTLKRLDGVIDVYLPWESSAPGPMTILKRQAWRFRKWSASAESPNTMKTASCAAACSSAT